jgi:hypothetical protein
MWISEDDMITRRLLKFSVFLSALGLAAVVAAQTPTLVGRFTSLILNGNQVLATAGTATVTVPNSTDTLVGKATSDTLTNKTLNAESTGNVVTLPLRWFLLAATCEGSAPYFPGWNMPTADAPTPTCVEGANVTLGLADFPDGSTRFLQTSLLLPTDWTGAIDLTVLWRSAVTSGAVVWQVQTACVAVGESVDPAWNTAQTIIDTAQGTTLLVNTAALASVTTTGCAAGEWLFLKVFRDPAHASDTLGATASLLATEWVYRRAL